MRFEFIKQHREAFEVTIMCRVLHVSRTGYYAWCKRTTSEREIANQMLYEDIYRVFHENRQVYGAIRVWKAQKKEGTNCGRDRVGRLMKENHLRPKRRVRTTKQDKSKSPSPNLIAQEFEASAPNKKWCADITYILTAEGGSIWRLLSTSTHAKSWGGRCPKR